MKRGTGAVGVQRQYAGTAGRGEDAQVAVYLVYAGRRGYAAVDRELYVPRSWTSDPDRCRAAGPGGETPFATQPELAVRKVARFLGAGHQAAWVAGGEVYGGNPKLRARWRNAPGATSSRWPARTKSPPAGGSSVSRWGGTLGMLAHVFLAIVRTDEPARRSARDALIPPTCNEVQRLLVALVVRPVHDIAQRLGWSASRRRPPRPIPGGHHKRQAAQA